MPTDDYVPAEWQLAKRPTGGWVILGAPSDGNGKNYRVTWPVSPDLQGLVETYRRDVWSRPEFGATIVGIGRLIDGLKRTGEYQPEEPFDLAAWVAEFEGVQAS